MENVCNLFITLLGLGHKPAKPMNLQAKDCHYNQPDMISGTFSNIYNYIVIAAE